LKGTACSSSTVTIRIKNGTAIVAQTPITINASSAASIPVSLNFTFPSTSLTLEIERTNFNVATCSALQIDNVYLTEKDWVNETFATIGNTSGYASSMPNALALTNTAQQLQLNYIAPSRGMGVSKKVTLDKDQKYTIGYSFKNKMGISANNFVLLELIKDGSIMYTRKLQATEATTFDYTAPATGEYTWRMRSSSIGTTTTQPLTYSLDNLSIFYTYPYTIENCDNLADGYRFGFNGKEDDRETGTQDYGFRIYNPALGKFLSVDPLTKDYPWYTPYQFAGNKPIVAVDLDGLEEFIKVKEFAKSKDGKTQTLVATTYKEVGFELFRKVIVGFEFKHNNTTYTANSNQTTFGRDGRGINPGVDGNFSSVYTLTKQDLSTLFAFGMNVINSYNDVDKAYMNESVGLGAKLDFKFTMYSILGIEVNSLIKINKVVYNANEAGNFIWGALNEYVDEVTNMTCIYDPSTLAQLGTMKGQLRFDEKHEQKALDDGENFGINISEDKSFNKDVQKKLENKEMFDESYIEE
jgi:RHS repeat-associated protein